MNRRVWIEDRTKQEPYREAVAKAKKAKRTPPGRWRVRWIDPEGKMKALTFPTLPEAENKKRDLERQLNGDEGATYLDPNAGKTLVVEIAEAWWKAADIKRSSRSRYRTVLDVHVLPKWGAVPIGAVTAVDLATWLASLKRGGGVMAEGDDEGKRLGASQKRTVYTLTNAVLDWAVPEKIAANPMRDKKKVKRPKPKKVHEHCYLDYAEIEALADVAAGLLTKYARPTPGAASGINRPLILTLAYTGIRSGEALALKAGAVDLTGARPTISIVATLTEDERTGELYEDAPKSHEARDVPLPPSLVPVLKPLVAGKAAGQYVFPGSDGGPLRLRNWRNREFYAARNRLKITDKLTPHKLRHTAASLAIRGGATVPAVQKLLGHASPVETLRTYTHLWDDELGKVADALDAGRLKALEDEG